MYRLSKRDMRQIILICKYVKILDPVFFTHCPEFAPEGLANPFSLEADQMLCNVAKRQTVKAFIKPLKSQQY